jgi:hypothetical protein
MSWFRLTVFIAGGFSLAATSTVNAQLFRRLLACAKLSIDHLLLNINAICDDDSAKPMRNIASPF